MLRNRLRRAALVPAVVVLLAVGAMVGAASSAHAVEIVPGIDVQSITVTGPGIDAPKELTPEQITGFVKAWATVSLFVPKTEKPPADAPVYTLHITRYAGGQLGEGEMRYVQSGAKAWFSGDQLLAKKQYIRAPVQAVDALKGVVPATVAKSASVPADASDASSDGGTSTGLVVGVLIAVVVLAALVALWIRQRRKPGSATA